jgi:aminoglycoside/choline kinase family phosphotransferase
VAESSTTPGDVLARIDRFLHTEGSGRHGATIMRLTGDAGDRQYFRVLRDGDAPAVLALHPGPIVFATLPFTNVARLLAGMPVPIPRILAHSDALGIISLEDLGDVTLQAHVEATSARAQDELYRQAVSFINTIQRRGQDLASPDYVPYGVAFDEKKLIWELQFFTANFLVAHRGATLTGQVQTALAGEYAGLARDLASAPRVLCHRDYHSRNLMLRDGSLHIIDFQDARMGPDTYDLVSLLRDSYVDIDDAQVDALIAYFLAGRASADEDAPTFRRRFDLMALQRNLKALGTFGFQAMSRGTSAYMAFVPRTLRHVRANLGTHTRFGRLQTLLAQFLPELR